MRACAIEMHFKISQEPLYPEVYRKNATPQNEPRMRTYTLCEPAQSKCISTFHKSNFLRKFTGKMLGPRVSTLIKHRPLHLPQPIASCIILYLCNPRPSLPRFLHHFSLVTHGTPKVCPLWTSSAVSSSLRYRLIVHRLKSNPTSRWVARLSLTLSPLQLKPNRGIWMHMVDILSVSLAFLNKQT